MLHSTPAHPICHPSDTPRGYQMSKYVFLLAAAVLSACAEAVDVGDREVWSDGLDATESPAPQVLYRGNTFLLGYAVDEVNLYLLIHDERRLLDRLVSCEFERCAHSLTTLAELPILDTE